MYVLTINRKTANEKTETFTNRNELRKRLMKLIFTGAFDDDSFHIKNTETGFQSRVTRLNFDFAVRRVH